MGKVPTIRMTKGSAVIVVNEDERASWEKVGYKVAGKAASEPQEPAADPETDQVTGDQEAAPHEEPSPAAPKSPKAPKARNRPKAE